MIDAREAVQDEAVAAHLVEVEALRAAYAEASGGEPITLEEGTRSQGVVARTELWWRRIKLLAVVETVRRGGAYLARVSRVAEPPVASAAGWLPHAW